MKTLLPLLAFTLGLAACRPSPVPERPSGAYASMSWMTQMRAYPSPDIPSTGVLDAAEATAAARKGAEMAAEPWEAIGPHNIGGRMLTVVFNPDNPNTVLAGSASGGLWRTFTGGSGEEAWHRVETGFPVLSVSAIAFAGADSSTILLGTGEVYNYGDRDGRGVTHRPTRGSYGIGILRSTDGGASWHKSLDWTAEQGRGVQMLVPNPSRPQTVWAATTEGLMVSYNAGESWQTSLDVVMATDVAIHPSDTTRVFAAHGNLGTPGHGLYRSLDSGATWTQLTSGLPATYGGKALLSIAPSDPETVYASIGNGFTSSAGNWLVRSTDAGTTWETVQEQTNYVGSQGWYSHDVWIHPADPNRLVVIGFLIHRSTDGGRILNAATEWQGWTVPAPPIGGHDGSPQYTHPDHHAMAVHPDDTDYMLFATDGGIYRTSDGGVTFHALNGGLQTVQFYAGMSNSDQETQIAVAGTQDNSTLVYRGSLEWRILSGGDGAWTAIDPVSSGRFYWSSQYLAMRRSSDRGVSSESIAPPGGSRPTGFVAPFVISPAAPERLYAGRDRVYTSRNRGTTWGTGNGGTPLTGEPLVSMAASSTDPNTVYALTAPGESQRGRAFVSRDAGGTWNDITGSLPDRYLVDVAVDPTDDRRAFVAIAGFGSDHVYRTEDRGQSWAPASTGLPDLPTWAVTVDPDYPDTLYAGNDLGVFTSGNGGANWEPFVDGLPEAIIAMDLDVSRQERVLRVATHGNGMFQRRLDGTTDFLPANPGGQQFDVVTVYPNPASAEVVATFVLNQQGTVHVGLYDSAGRLAILVADESMGSGRTYETFDVSGLAAGTYYLSVVSESFAETVPVAVVR